MELQPDYYYNLGVCMIRKQSQDDEAMQNSNGNYAIQSKIQKIQSKSMKMYENIEQILTKAINTIEKCEQQIMQDQKDVNACLMNMHVKMTQFKPLKSLKDQYNDFYKKLSGFGKSIQQVPEDYVFKYRYPKLFQQAQIQLIQQSISNHYLSQKNYDAAESILPSNQKKKHFQQCYQLRADILDGQFDRPAQWVQKAGLSGNEAQVAYQIQKMKVICLVRQNKADQAIAYLRQNLANYSNTHGSQISKLMSFIITQSQKYWGSQADYTDIYKNRYNAFLKVSVEQLANKFTQVYLKVNKIYLKNPITQCHEVGLKYRQQFIEQLKYIPQGQFPATLPFSIKMRPQEKYHSCFFCPVSKQVFSSHDKNVILHCGHMVSNPAISKLTEGRDSRRKIKCPICQSDQVIQNNMKVQF